MFDRKVEDAGGEGRGVGGELTLDSRVGVRVVGLVERMIGVS
jgi:hypothetical protein